MPGSSFSPPLHAWALLAQSKRQARARRVSQDESRACRRADFFRPPQRKKPHPRCDVLEGRELASFRPEVEPLTRTSPAPAEWKPIRRVSSAAVTSRPQNRLESRLWRPRPSLSTRFLRSTRPRAKCLRILREHRRLCCRRSFLMLALPTAFGECCPFAIDAQSCACFATG